MRPRDLILPAVAAVLSLAILGHLIATQPDPAAWPRCEYFRCRDCGGPASIDPDQPERWGCRTCGVSTFRIAEQFRIATRDDFDGEAAFIRAMWAAGTLAPCDLLTPAAIYSEAGGRVE